MNVRAGLDWAHRSSHHLTTTYQCPTQLHLCAGARVPFNRRITLPRPCLPDTLSPDQSYQRRDGPGGSGG